MTLFSPNGSVLTARTSSFGYFRFDEIASGVDARRFATQPSWLSCRVEDDVWHGAGDAAKLEVILDTFLDWAELHGAD